MRANPKYDDAQNYPLHAISIQRDTPESSLPWGREPQTARGNLG